MIFEWKNEIVALEALDLQFEAPLAFENTGLWVCILSSGECTLSSAPNLVGNPGTLIIGQAPFTLCPTRPCHLLAVRLSGRLADRFAAGLQEHILFAKGESCRGAAGLLQQLAENTPSQSRAHSILAYTLLCEIANANSTEQSLPPLIAEAVEEMQKGYAHLYGIDELSEQLGVSKSHFVRAFHAAMGISPGKYLTTIRIEAVKRLLLHREYNLEVIASLCGFSGANYLCRVFKRETGQSPASWRAVALAQSAPHLSETQNALEHALYF
ncbi:MAG: AraC family transcriptional regulator [Faecalibacterium sp.]